MGNKPTYAAPHGIPAGTPYQPRHKVTWRHTAVDAPFSGDRLLRCATTFTLPFTAASCGSCVTLHDRSMSVAWRQYCGPTGYRLETMLYPEVWFRLVKGSQSYLPMCSATRRIGFFVSHDEDCTVTLHHPHICLIKLRAWNFAPPSQLFPSTTNSTSTCMHL
jgi:hypothetical protein